MIVLCAPDKFKGTLTATEAADAMARGVGFAGAHADLCPVADGGEGTLNVLVRAMNGEIRRTTVTGPLGEPVTVRFGIVDAGRTGIVELAEASGLSLLPPDRRDPIHTTTYGTGQLIATAVEAGCETIILGIGGSATCDGGAGITQALGGAFLDQSGQLIREPITGGMLLDIAGFTPLRSPPVVRVACDVMNPMHGRDGAAVTYGPQKGATPSEVRRLEAGLVHLAKIAAPNVDPATPGFGAAGGAGFGLAALCGAELCRGAELVLDAIRFTDRCRAADLVLTGEGRLDAQTLHGKACHGVAAAARDVGTPVVAIVGALEAGMIEEESRSIQTSFGEERAVQDTAKLLAEVAGDLVRAHR
jgi:glycerate kinase